MANYNFELVSPEEKLVSEPVQMAVIPGVEGQMGVGAGHTSFVVALKAGVVELFKDKGNTPSRRIFIAGGFADVTGAACTVLAEEAVNVNELNQEKIEQDIKNLNEDLARATDAIEKTRIEKRIKLAIAKIEAITGKPAV
jgi:F-type H+-transporting ATPase subunit epsilon